MFTKQRAAPAADRVTAEAAADMQPAQAAVEPQSVQVQTAEGLQETIQAEAEAAVEVRLAAVPTPPAAREDCLLRLEGKAEV